MEHLIDPLATITKLAMHTDTIVLSTYLMPTPAPLPDDWWYDATDTSQHISFASRTGLAHLADRLGVHLHSRSNTHVLTRRRFPATALAIALRPRCAVAAYGFTARPTLLQHDYEALLRRQRASSRTGDGA